MTWDDHYIAREGLREQVGENSARLAFAWGTSTTTGQGGLAHPEVVNFGLAFIEKPMFAYGFEVLNRIDFVGDDGTSDPTDLAMPVSSGFVYHWRLNAAGLYIGAHVAVQVVCDDDIQIEHHFGFTGTAMKDFGNSEKLDG